MEPTTPAEVNIDDIPMNDPCPPRYVRGKVTVIANVTGAILMLPMIRTGPGAGLQMDPGEIVDLEEVCHPARIEHSGIDRAAKQGHVVFYRKGSTPKVPEGPKRLEVGQVTPPNIYDQKFDEVAEKEQRHDEKTKSGNLRRAQ